MPAILRSPRAGASLGAFGSLRRSAPQFARGGHKGVRAVNCTSCGASNEVDAVFGEECGESFRRECPSCGTSCSPRAKFCRKCRASLGGDTVAKTSERDPRSYTPKHLAERILAERAAMESRG